MATSYSLVCACLLTYAHAVDQGDEECDESKDKDDNANVPDDRGVGQLEDDDEPDADEDEGEVDFLVGLAVATLLTRAGTESPSSFSSRGSLVTQFICRYLCLSLQISYYY